MKPIVIFGIGDFGALMHFYLTTDSSFKVAGFAVDKTFKNKEEFCGLKVVDFSEVEKYFPPQDYSMFIAIGYPDFNNIRTARFLEAQQKGYQLINYISSKATLPPNFKLGANSCILENNIIQPFVMIGDNVIVWSGCHIGHHSQIENNCFLAPCVTLAGRVTIKENSFIGINVTIKDFVTIEKNNIIGAGALVLKDTIDSGVYIGSPARFTQRIHELKTKYTVAHRLKRLTLSEVHIHENTF